MTRTVAGTPATANETPHISPIARDADPAPHPADPAAYPADALLRTAIRLDAWAAGAFGVFLLTLGSLIDGPLGLPLAWSVPFGVAMLGGALALALITGYPAIPVPLAVLVVACNAASSAAMVVLAFVDLVPVTGRGSVFMLSGAVVVGAFAAAEYVGLGRVRAPEGARP
ncbi:hypothetical protein OG216_11925 [Streptomycetaceae bacterium NBC_01309]